MIFYGKNIVNEIIKSQRFDIKKIYISSENLFKSFHNNSNISIQSISKEKMTDLTQTSNHQNIAIEINNFPYYSFENINISKIQKDKSGFVIFDSIQDPHNLGASLRNCFCFGIKNVIIQNRNSVDITSTVMKSSAGAAAHINIYSVVNLSRVVDLFKNNFIPVFALDTSGNNYLETINFTFPFLLIVGSEDKGIRFNLLKKTDTIIKIKQTEKFNSLNLSSSLAICLYEISKIAHLAQSVEQHTRNV